MFILRWLSIGFALICGVFTSQAPEFSQQYSQRLGGALDELNRMLADFDLDARANNMNRAQGIDKLRNESDPFIKQRGQRIAETDVRAAKLTRQQENFRNAGTFTRMAVMARDYDAGIAARAWENFKPAVPMTMEGLISAAAGFIAGLGIWKFLGAPFALRRRRLALRQQGSLSA